MKKDQMIDTLGQIDDDMVQRVEALRQKKRKPVWVKWGALAACLCLAVGIYSSVKFGFPPPLGGEAGGGGGEGIGYMSYAGPVFPLTSLDRVNGITVQRNVNYDFSPYKTVIRTFDDEQGSHSYEDYGSNTIVTDRYIMANESDQDQTLTLLYPFAASLRDDLPVCPEITVDGNALTPELFIGPYSGGFQGVGGGGESLNLAQLDSWEQYKALFSDGSYRDDALSAFPQLSQPVVVYELSDRRASAEAENPDLVVEMDLDYQKTTVLSYGFNSGRCDIETGYCARGTHVPKSFNPDYGESAYLLILGEEPNYYTLTGYRDGGWEHEDASVTANVKRYESTLGEMLRILNRIYFEKIAGIVYDDDDADVLMSALTEEQRLGVVAEHLLSYGLLSQAVTERYDSGMLEEIMGDAYAVQRVMYLRFELTIPARESIEVSANMTKKASIDFVGKKRGRNGYDMLMHHSDHVRAEYSVISAKKQERRKVYILLTRFPDAFSKMVSFMTGFYYTHASIGLEEDGNTFYSFVTKGFIVEKIDRYIRPGRQPFPCMLYEIEVSNEVYERIKRIISIFVVNKDCLTYTKFGLALCMLHISCQRQNRFFCSQFVAYVLAHSGAAWVKKDSALFLPKDFSQLDEVRVVFSGNLLSLCSNKSGTLVQHV